MNRASLLYWILPQFKFYVPSATNPLRSMRMKLALFLKLCHRLYSEQLNLPKKTKIGFNLLSSSKLFKLFLSWPAESMKRTMFSTTFLIKISTWLNFKLRCSVKITSSFPMHSHRRKTPTENKFFQKFSVGPWQPSVNLLLTIFKKSSTAWSTNTILWNKSAHL